jgi:hypothetical protein
MLLARRSLEPVTQRAIVALFETPFLALALAGLDQVHQTPRTLDRRFAALGAAVGELHPQLVLPLPRNRQVGELIFNPSSHFFPFRAVN